MAERGLLGLAGPLLISGSLFPGGVCVSAPEPQFVSELEFKVRSRESLLILMGLLRLVRLAKYVNDGRIGAGA